MNTATNVKEARALLKGADAGDRLIIRGYVDSEGGGRKDLEIELLGPEGYKGMQEDSLRKLRRTSPAMLSGFPVDVAEKALQELVRSLEKATGVGPGMVDTIGPVSGGPANDYVAKDGFFEKPGNSGAIYLLRLRSVSSTVLEQGRQKNSRELTKAKEAWKELLDLPVRHYIHALKLEDRKFTELVR